MIRISKLYSTFLYVGFFKWAPGTLGTLVSIILLYLLINFINFQTFIFIFIFLLIISFKLVEIYSNNVEKDDPKEIIIDEFLGIYLTMILSYKFNELNISVYLILSFIFFRFFDILKIFPANWIDNKIKNSYGIIFDDLIAGIYTAIIIGLINVFI